MQQVYEYGICLIKTNKNGTRYAAYRDINAYSSG